MNILSINSLKLQNPTLINNTNVKNNLNYNFNLNYKKQPLIDTVSFKETPKEADKNFEINRQTAKNVRLRSLQPFKRVHKFINDNFEDLLVSPQNPENPLVSIPSRLKSEDGIIAKTGSRQWTNIDEIITFMTDLLGTSFVFRSDNKQKNDAVLDRFIPLIKSGCVDLIEIENKRPIIVEGLDESQASKYDYNSIKMLTKLADIQDTAFAKRGSKEKVRRRLFDDFTKANYCATHYLFRLPGKEPIIFEHQVTGYNVKLGKNVDDPLWKALIGKHSADATPEFDEIMRPFTDPYFFSEEPNAEELVNNAKKILNKYRADVLLFQREKASLPFSKKKGREMFLPIRERLFPCEIELKYGISTTDFDFNNLVKLLRKKI